MFMLFNEMRITGAKKNRATIMSEKSPTFPSTKPLCLMKMTPDRLRINNIDFKWGTTFEEARRLLPFEGIQRGYSAWQGFEFKCSEIVSLGATTCSVRGPRAKLPVMQISFGLKPLKKGLFDSHHSPYLKKLRKIFGEPHGISKSEIHSGLKYNEKYASGAVIYNCKWWYGEVLISLSVYGGIRTSPQGESAAGIYFDWMNEKSAAAPYMKDYIGIESRLTQNISEHSIVSSSVNARPYYRSHYELNDPHEALKNEELRACQMALYTSKLYRTPEFLKSKIEENNIGVFYSKEEDAHCVYNKWDFSPITKDSTLEYVDILPARGGGSKELRINSLTLKDERSSNVLDTLKSELEKLSGMQFKCIKGYDD